MKLNFYTLGSNNINKMVDFVHWFILTNTYVSGNKDSNFFQLLLYRGKQGKAQLYNYSVLCTNFGPSSLF